MRENPDGLNLGLREQRKKRSTSQEPDTLAVMMKRLMVLCHFQDSLRASRANHIGEDTVVYS